IALALATEFRLACRAGAIPAACLWRRTRRCLRGHAWPDWRNVVGGRVVCVDWCHGYHLGTCDLLAALIRVTVTVDLDEEKAEHPKMPGRMSSRRKAGLGEGAL